MTEQERDTFDRQGYLVIEDALSDDEPAELNWLVDDRDLADPALVTGEGRCRSQEGTGAGGLEWGTPFCDLLDHERVCQVLHRARTTTTEVGSVWRPSSGPPCGREHRLRVSTTVDTVRAGALPPHPARRHVRREGHRGVEPPGRRPKPWRTCPRTSSPRRPRRGRSWCSRALTHGTTPWVADRRRRSLRFAYDPGHQAISHPSPEPPEDVDITPHQPKLFGPAYDDRGLFED